MITDAAPSLEDEQRRRKRVYTAIMAVHVAGFAAALALAGVHLWWWALGVFVIAAPLRFVAALVTNAGAAERIERGFAARQHRHRRDSS